MVMMMMMMRMIVTKQWACNPWLTHSFEWDQGETSRPAQLLMMMMIIIIIIIIMIIMEMENVLSTFVIWQWLLVSKVPSST